jgi:hypothetical protein
MHDVSGVKRNTKLSEVFFNINDISAVGSVTKTLHVQIYPGE